MEILKNDKSELALPLKKKKKKIIVHGYISCSRMYIERLSDQRVMCKR